jgi:thioredoxin 1
LSAQWAGTLVHAEHEVESSQFEPGVPDEDQAHQHVLDFQIMSLEIAALYGISERFAVDLSIPLRLTSVGADFLGDQGQHLSEFDSIHHRKEVIAGLADIELGGRYRLIRPSADLKLSVDLRAGISLPTGSIQPDPFVLGEMGKQHQHLFYGNGTFDPVAGLEAFYNLGSYALMGWTSARMPLVENEHGYRGRTTINGGLGLAHSFGLKDWRFLVQMLGRHEEPALWSGAPARNSGLTELMAAGGVLWAASPSITMSLSLKTSIVRKARGGILEMPGLLGFGVSYTLPTKAVDAHDHGHDDEDEEVHTATTGDVQDAARGGESFELAKVLVPGKVTVIDFWAEWCHPCIHIAQALSGLAAQHDTLAVRKVEVPDFDEPVAVEHLKGESALPIVWIYGPDGKLITKLIGTSEEQVREAVEGALKHASAPVL